MSNTAYKRAHGGHDYMGRTEGRGGRKDNKLRAALKGVASFSLLDQVARDDAQRRRQQRQEVAA